jgi:F-type H+-transporting ATPase subunit epsilon
MIVEIITPEHKLFEGEATAIQLPGKDGLFQILDNHAPIIATLADGTVKIDLPKSFERAEDTPAQLKSEGSTLKLQIVSGVIEVSGNKAIVLVN